MRKEEDKVTCVYNNTTMISICAVMRVKIKPSLNAAQKFMVLFMRFNGNFLTNPDVNVSLKIGKRVHFVSFVLCGLYSLLLG